MPSTLSPARTAGPRLLTDADLHRALDLRDLSDPRQGPHAIQHILDALRSALERAWGCDVRTHRDHPVVSIHDCYDALGYPPDAVTREARYTRYVARDRVLRTHTTALVPPLLRDLAAEADAAPRDVLLVCPGLAYRRDSIDRLHVGEPHQCDLWRLRRGTALDSDDLREMIVRVVDAALPGVPWRSIPRPHPYTLHGVQVDAHVGGAWIEILECGIASPVLLRDSGLSPRRWSGLAMGLGLDRLLMLRKGIDDIRLLRSDDPRIAAQMLDLAPYRPVSAQPPIRRDLSVAVGDDVDAETIGDRVRSAAGADLESIEDVALLSETPGRELPLAARTRIGLRPGQKNVLLRVVLRHPTRTLTAGEANRIRDVIYAAVHEGTAWQWAGAGGP